MGKLPSAPWATLLRPSSQTAQTPQSLSTTGQIRHATLVRRPRRPYTFTQLVQLSDGSTYTMRSTSPQSMYRSQRDTRNTLLWQPSEKSLRNVELDEAGKLAAFRERFGRSFDIESGAVEGEDGVKKDDAAVAAAAEAKKDEVKVDNSFADLISGYAEDEDYSRMKDQIKAAPVATGKKKK